MFQSVPGPAIGTPTPTPSLRTVAYFKLDDAQNSLTMADATGRGNALTRYLLPAASSLTFAIAANEAGGQTTTGELAKWGIWNRVLSAGEIAALATGIGWPFTGGNASLADAKAYYLLNEAGGSSSYADATGRGNTLTKAGTNATVQAAGPLGSDFSTKFDGTNWLQRAATADLAPGNTSHTIVGWVKLDALGSTEQTFWGQFDAGIRTGDVVYYHEIYGWINWDFGNDVNLFRNAVTMTSNFGHPTTAAWYFIVCIYDQVANVMYQSVNGSAYNTLSHIQGPYQDTGKIGGGIAAHFQVNPNGNATQLSGWDQVGAAVNCNRAVNGDLGIGNGGKTVWGWVKFDDFTTTQSVCGLWNLSGNVGDWLIQQSAGSLSFYLGDSAGHFDSASVTLGDTAWHLFVAWFDKLGDGKIHLNLDNGAQVATPVTPTHAPASGTVAFIMGAATNTGTSSGFDQQLIGTLDGVGIASGVPSAADIAALWNGGAGTDAYPP